jgi:hypothetical protein
MSVARRLACLGLATLLPAVAMAEDATAQFRYVTDYDRGRLGLHIVADLAAAPPSLTVDDKNLGCKWTAKKE